MCGRERECEEKWFFRSWGVSEFFFFFRLFLGEVCLGCARVVLEAVLGAVLGCVSDEFLIAKMVIFF